MKINKVLTQIALVATLALPAAADVVNGSFESGSCNPGGFFTTVTAVDSTCITGWTVSGGTVDYIGGYWQAGDGSRSVDLSGNGNGTIEQSFATVAGRTYQVDFLISGNPDGPPVTKLLTASAGNFSGGFNYTLGGANSRPNMLWESRSFLFTANSALTTLSFAGIVGTPYGAALDGVSVTAVPEPAALGLFLLLGAAPFVASRRKR